MIGIKVIEILKVLSSDQLKEIELFLSTPFFNKRKSLLDFYKYVIKFHPYYQHDFSDLNAINKYLKDKNKIDLNHIVKLFSFLFKELERYIVIKKIEEDKLYTQNILGLYYNHKNLDYLYENTSNLLETNLKTIPSYDIINYFYNENKCSFLSKNDIRKGDVNYVPLSESLDAFYYYNRLRLFCLMLNRSLVIGLDYSSQFNSVYFNTNVIERLNIDAINIYYKIYVEFQSTITQNTYDIVLNYLEKIDQNLSIDDLRIIYTILINVGKNVFTNKNEYHQKIFYLYKRQLNLGSIYYDTKIHIGNLKNIVILAINANELVWATDFLNKHKESIIPNEENYESFYFLMAEVFFAKKEYNEALDMLAKTKTNDVLIKLAIKRMYLKIFFELNEDNIFESNIASFKVFIGREKGITLEKKEAEKNFVNSLALLWKYRLSKQKNKIVQLAKKNNELAISDKKWLLETIEQIIK